jgi:hypothetical protein
VRAVLEEILDVEFLGDEDTGYPTGGFLAWAYERLGVTEPDQVVHLFGGGLKRGVTVDLRPEMNPTYCCDAAHTPIDTGSVDWVMSDPPTSELWNAALYGIPSKLPTELELLTEVRRILKVGGCFGMLQPTVPENIPGLVREKTYAITTGAPRFVCGWHLLRRV